MAFHFLIDGYNLLYALPHMPAGAWQEKRDHLLAFLKSQRLQGNNPITIVFDSREGLGDRSQQGDVTVVYTAGETADDRISEMVHKAPNPSLFVVVSNDQGIRRQVGGTGARFMTADDFLKSAPSPRPPDPRKNRNPPAAAQEITEEFKKKWL